MTLPSNANFDTQATEFIGRETELETVRELLAEGRRLVTILGTAGTGKTRLARELGLRCPDLFEGGVWFCDLSQARNDEDAVTAVASQMEISLEEASSLEERRERVGRAIADR